ncbi:MAG: phosphoribosyl-AMP cyclohydrolase [Acidobacteria bacterium]|nr:phosphoribosyl-AMP cyclohydrolase [Acidobacteriota bacterium]
MLNELDFDKTGGMIPAVVQDSGDGRVLMLGFMNREAFEKTVETGKVTFWSRSRNELWTKGGSSGHYLAVQRIEIDCDGDTLLIQAESLGPGVCHNGYRSCFYRRLEDGRWEVSEERTYDPKAVYQK